MGLGDPEPFTWRDALKVLTFMRVLRIEAEKLCAKLCSNNQANYHHRDIWPDSKPIWPPSLWQNGTLTPPAPDIIEQICRLGDASFIKKNKALTPKNVTWVESWHIPLLIGIFASCLHCGRCQIFFSKEEHNVLIVYAPIMTSQCRCTRAVGQSHVAMHDRTAVIRLSLSVELFAIGSNVGRAMKCIRKNTLEVIC